MEGDDERGNGSERSGSEVPRGDGDYPIQLFSLLLRIPSVVSAEAARTELLPLEHSLLLLATTP